MAEEVNVQETPDVVSDNMWSDNQGTKVAPPKAQEINLDSVDIDLENPKQPKEEVPQPAKTDAPVTTTTPVPEFDINKFVKEEYGFDSKEVAKEQIEKWRKSEAEPKKEPEPIKPKFDNEESERLYNAFVSGNKKDILEVLKKQDEIERAAGLSPIEQIKLDLQYKNKNYSKEDIEDVIEERYSHPKKPVQRDDELDDEFAARTDAYQKEVAKVDRRINRDGLEAVENLQKHKTDLVLPNDSRAAEYQKFVQQQKELEAEESKARENYKAVLDKDYSSFKGYATAYKDKEIEVPIEYKPTEQELKELKNEFENDFDADEFLANRWIKTENNKVVGHNISTQMADVYLIKNQQKIFDKIANDSAARAVAAYLKNEHNINFTSGSDKIPQQNVAQANDEKIGDKIWGD